MRKLVGWDHYETLAAQQALNALYADLRLFQNLFQPSLKRQRKERRGSRLLRRYESPQTPFARVRASTVIGAATVAALERLFQHTDPFVLAQRIGQHLDRLVTLRSRAPQSAPRLSTRWRGWTFSPRAPHCLGRTFDLHNWRRSHDRLGRHGTGRGGIPARHQVLVPVRISNDATRVPWVRNSDGLIGGERPSLTARRLSRERAAGRKHRPI